MRKPRRLSPGDNIGVVAPSSPISRSDLAAGVAMLEARGYRVTLGENVLATHPTNSYLAGTDAQRASDLNTMLTRPDVDAVFCARGGYGAVRILDRICWNSLPAHPRIFVGYSDITSLHLALERAGWSTFHGPMVGALPGLNSKSHDLFWTLLEEPRALGRLPAEEANMVTVSGGRVAGVLTGGCLCLLARACGSRFAPDFTGKIVLLEDVGEAVYQADRDLAQLRNAGLLEQAAGFVIGNISRWGEHEGETTANSPASVWRDYFGESGKPVISGFPFGHEPNPLTLPLGAAAHLDADARTVTLLDAAVT